MGHPDRREGAVTAHVVTVGYSGAEPLLASNHAFDGTGCEIAGAGDMDDVVRRLHLVVIPIVQRSLDDLHVTFMPGFEVGTLPVFVVLSNLQVLVLRRCQGEPPVGKTDVADTRKKHQLTSLDLGWRERILLELFFHPAKHLAELRFVDNAIILAVRLREYKGRQL